MHVHKTARILKSLFIQFISRTLSVQFVFSWNASASTLVNAIVCNLNKDNDQMKIGHEQIDCHQSPSFFFLRIQKQKLVKSIKQKNSKAHTAYYWVNGHVPIIIINLIK